MELRGGEQPASGAKSHFSERVKFHHRNLRRVCHICATTVPQFMNYVPPYLPAPCPSICAWLPSSTLSALLGQVETLNQRFGRVLPKLTSLTSQENIQLSQNAAKQAAAGLLEPSTVVAHHTHLRCGDLLSQWRLLPVSAPYLLSFFLISVSLSLYLSLSQTGAAEEPPKWLQAC